MPTNLITIAKSGTAAARASIELTAQNIANSGNPNYVRRSLQLGESVGVATIDFQTSSSLNGVRIGGIQRADSELVQRQARDSGSDLSRAQAELSGLRDAETALENSGLYRGLVNFEASLTLLESDPTDPALRTGAIESARQLAETFHFAEAALSNARSLVEDDISVGIAVVNGAAVELARVNQELTNARDGTAAKASLLDARDAALRDIADEFGTIVEFDDKGRAEVRITANPPPAGESGALLVSGVTANTASATILPDGSTQIDLDGNVFASVGGAMAGRAASLADIATRQDDLNAAALESITRINNAQAAGVALDGSAGTPLFSGTNASDITLVLQDGDGLALAAAGSPAGSRDTGNLGNMLASYGADDGPIRTIDRSLLSLSSRIAGLETTREGLAIINASAEAELLTETGVDLDVEAANLVRLQQAFEANSRVIQVASELFDTILGLR